MNINILRHISTSESRGWNPSLERKRKSPTMLLIELSAEREGFEPPVPLSTAVFKTAVIDHSTISPSDCVWLLVGKTTGEIITNGMLRKFPLLRMNPIPQAFFF